MWVSTQEGSKLRRASTQPASRERPGRVSSRPRAGSPPSQRLPLRHRLRQAPPARVARRPFRLRPLGTARGRVGQNQRFAQHRAPGAEVQRSEACTGRSLFRASLAGARGRSCSGRRAGAETAARSSAMRTHSPATALRRSSSIPRPQRSSPATRPGIWRSSRATSSDDVAPSTSH